MRLIQAITGSAFLLFSGMCLATRYIMTAVLYAGVYSEDSFFSLMLRNVPVPLTAAMYITLGIGVILIVMSLKILERAEEPSDGTTEN